MQYLLFGYAPSSFCRLFYLILACVLFNTQAQQSNLPVDTVFTPSVAAVTDSTITLHMDVRPGYYLYASRLFSIQWQNDKTNQPGQLKLITQSPTVNKDDPYFGNQKVWLGDAKPLSWTYQYTLPTSSETVTTGTLIWRYQGCEEGGICYPPQEKALIVDITNVNKADSSQKTLNNKAQNNDNSDKSLINTASDSGLETSTNNPLFNQSIGGGQSSLGAQEQAQSLFTTDSQRQLLTENEAFPFHIEQIDSKTYRIHWQVADGYYLYRDKTFLEISSTSDARIVDVKFSEGELHEDEFFGQQVVYRDNQANVQFTLDKPLANLTLYLAFQGCADAGVCYPVMTREIELVNGQSTAITSSDVDVFDNSMQSPLSETLKERVFLSLILLFAAGLALSFTPCVLPMLPILMGIITNQNRVSKKRAGALALAYALGVSVMMAIFGLVVSATQINLQIIFQKPLWLVLFALIFIALGLAMLGVFSISTPGIIQQYVIRWQQRLQQANLLSLFIIGALSTLIVGPCVAPPLIAILAFISVTNDSLLGALYLFALGLGMSLPLVAFATFVPVIPKTGALSRLITRLFAFLMFAVAIWLLTRLVSGAVSLLIWGMYLLIIAYIIFTSGFTKKLAVWIARFIAFLFMSVGLLWIIGGLMGNSHPLKPLTKLHYPTFIYVNDAESLQTELSNTNQLVMLDFYADWCVACQEIEHLTLTDPIVHEVLDDMVLLKLDITDTTPAHRALMQQLNLIGPPALLFYRDGKEISQERNIGTISAKKLRQKIIRMQSQGATLN